MNKQELVAMVKTMRKLGVTRYKEGDVEIDLSTAPATKPKIPKISKEDRQKIKDTTEEIKSVMGLDDDQLLDRMFPVSKEDEAGNVL